MQVERLEPRQLLDATSTGVHVQFGPEKLTPAEGYVVDAGRAFATQGSQQLTFGWTANRAAKPVVRKHSPLAADARYDSFAALKPGAAWEIAAPNGTYSVHLVAGDAKAKKATYAIDVEGVPAVRGSANAQQRWVETNVDVTVNDGRLTVSSPPGAKKNRLNFLDITPIDTESPFPPAAGATPAPSQPSGTADAEGFFPLFNGKDLTGFTPFIDGLRAGQDPHAFFKVQGGALHVMDIASTGREQPFGYLSTNAAYGEYHLQFQYRWGTKKFAPRNTDDTPRDAGLLFHVRGQDVVWPQSVEVQVQEGDTGDVWSLGSEPTSVTATVDDTTASPVQYSEDGSRTTVSGNRVKKSRTVDSLTDWNTVDVFAQGDTAVVVVNGTVVNRVTDIDDADGNPLTSGRIALQAEGAELWYRNLRIKPLGAWGVGGTPPVGSDAVTLLGTNADDSTNARFVQRESGAPLAWDIDAGVMTVSPGAGDVQSTDGFAGDYTLHLEFMVPPTSDDRGEQDRGNSGVGLNGSYELQILDTFGHELSGANDLGAVYSIADAVTNAALPAGVWQSYDVQFTAPRYDAAGAKTSNARVTVRLNGVLVHDDVEVPNSTLTFDPESPGPRPLVLQDHGHAVRFQNIWVDPG
jgi:hypothetical protein